MGTYGKEAYPDDNTQATAMVVVQQPESVTRQSPSSIRPRGLRGASAVSQMPFKCPHCSICKSETICICNWLTLRVLTSLCA